MPLNTEYAYAAWGPAQYAHITSTLHAAAEEEYRAFQKKIIPECDPILGVRMPFLQKMAAGIVKGGGATGFLCGFSPSNFEERMLQGLVLARLSLPFEEDCMNIRQYAKSIRCWAHCDYFCAACKKIGAQREQYLPFVVSLTASSEPWVIRTGLVLLLWYYLKEPYTYKALRATGEVQSDFYYVKMARAWLYCEAFLRFPRQTADFLHQCPPDPDTLHKTIQKVRDSRRIDQAAKEQTRLLERSVLSAREQERPL